MIVESPAERTPTVFPEPFDPALDDADIDLDTRLRLFRCQQEIRQLERRLHDLFLQNLVKGTSHLAIGMEATAAAFGVALRPDDYTFATYRGHGHTIARGVPLGPIIAEMLGRGTGLLGGKGGSMHLTSVEHGMMGSYAIVGAHLCIANGAAWSAQLRGTDQVAVAFFGDGATNIGAFHEALNFAAVYKLPVIFVCENNLYMEYTAIGDVTAVRHPAAERAVGVRAGTDGGRRQRRRCGLPGGAGGDRARPVGWRPVADRGEDVPPRRPQPRRPGHVPARRGGRGVDRPRPDPDVPPAPAPPRRRRGAAHRDRHERRGGDRRRDRGGQGGGAAGPGRAVDQRLGRRGVAMAQLTYREAVARGIAQEMRRDPTVVFLGEDVAGAGGVFKTTAGLLDEFGPTRVVDTPISEQAILGAAMGAAMTGMRPIAEIMFADFFAVCWDMVVNEIAKARYMTNGQVSCPLVIKSGNGGSVRFGAQHSQSVENWAMSVPGIKVVAPVDGHRRRRADGGRGPRSRSGAVLRAQGPVRVEGGRARRRDRRLASARPRCGATAATARSWRSV